VHLDTKSIVALMSCSESHCTAILVKWMPFGRSNSRLVMDWIPSYAVSNLREPASLGEVEGGFHSPLIRLWPKETNVKSSRRGKDQTRPNISESGGR